MSYPCNPTAQVIGFASANLDLLREKCAQIFTEDSLKDFQKVRIIIENISGGYSNPGCHCRRNDLDEIINILSKYFIQDGGKLDTLVGLRSMVSGYKWIIC